MSLIKTKKKGSLIIVSGPSGSGKDTICNKVLNNNPNMHISISCTTRSIRDKEIDGVNYYFKSKSEFEDMIRNNEFIEYAIYNDNYYGTLKKEVEDRLNNGIDVILVIEVQGALKVREIYPDAIFIFIVPPSMKELKNRLVNRNTEDSEKIFKRLKTAYREINELSNYNYVVVNDEIELAVKKIESIILVDKLRTDKIEEVFVDNIEEIMHESLIEKN